MRRCLIWGSLLFFFPSAKQDADFAMASPAVLFALLIGYILTRMLQKAALPAAIVGAIVTFIFAVSSSAGSEWVRVSTLIVAGLLPLGVLLLARVNRPIKPDTGSAGTD